MVMRYRQRYQNDKVLINVLKGIKSVESKRQS
jgi:hypothetical protein